MTLVPRILAATSALALTAAATIPVLAAGGDPLRLLELSSELYVMGLADGDPLLLIAAAKLRRDIEFEPAEGSAEGLHSPVGWEMMLDAARVAANGDEALVALIDDVADEGSRGVTTGQVYSIAKIGVGGLDTYDPLPFKAGEYAEVYVESADGSDLNVYVYDAGGELVCADTDASPISYCGWRPAEAGDFVIKVENRGGTEAGYALMTN